MNNHDFGVLGEEGAAKYLAGQNYHILNRNFRVGRMGEIDIIARDGDTLCFIEVKTRSNNNYGTPAQAVSYNKQTTIKRIAAIYMQRFGIKDSPVRFDIAEINMDREGKIRDIQIIKNAF